MPYHMYQGRGCIAMMSTQSSNLPFSLAHSAESRFLRQKVTYFNKQTRSTVFALALKLNIYMEQLP